jgi:hypothetical protein
MTAKEASNKPGQVSKIEAFTDALLCYKLRAMNSEDSWTD